MNGNIKHYQGKSDDDALLSIIKHYQTIDFFANFVEFCRLKHKGLRKPTLAKLNLFIADCKTKSIAEQRQIIKALYDLPHVIRVKALSDYMLACAKDWLADEPANADLYYRLGQLTNDRLYYFKGLEIDPTHLDCARQVIFTKLNFVDYQLHHVSESKFVYDCGDVEDGKQALQEVQELIKKYPELDDYVKSEYQETKQLFEDWLSFINSDFEDFPTWCRINGRNYRFASIVYYDK